MLWAITAAQIPIAAIETEANVVDQLPLKIPFDNDLNLDNFQPRPSLLQLLTEVEALLDGSRSIAFFMGAKRLREKPFATRREPSDGCSRALSTHDGAA